MEPTWIVAAQESSDGSGQLDEIETCLARLERARMPVRTLTIDPLRAGWSTPLQPDHYRSGCAPIEALQAAHEMLLRDEAQAVLITGRDFLRTEYGREERLRLMAIYGEKPTIPECYDQLFEKFAQMQHWPLEALDKLCDAVFRNCMRTYLGRGGKELPERRWYAKVTTRFRGVDCANPVVDFSGALVVVSSAMLPLVGKLELAPVAVAGVGVAQTPGDGPEFLAEIARYEHLRAAIFAAETRAGMRIANLARTDRVVIEAYTCFPVVPLAFLVSTGLVSSLGECLTLLERMPITVTGGMNLAKAPWNNPALRGLVAVVNEIRKRKANGVVHGNGGLGGRQGIAILTSG